jgi:hypothetical protein
MPLARIITEHAEESLELAIQLRSRGFEVETVPPSQVPETPADLEIQLDACGADQILEQVISASADEDLNVFVAPGALDESFSAQPIRLAPPTFKRSPVETPAQFAEVASVAALDRTHDHSEVSWTVPAAMPVEMESHEPITGHFDFEEAEIETNRVVEVEGASEHPAEIHAETGIHSTEGERATTLTVLEAPDLEQSEAEPVLPALVSRSPEPNPENKTSRWRRADTLFLRVAILAAALAAVVVVVGSVWQQRHPAAATLPTVGSQQVPFQKAQGQNSSGQKSAEQKGPGQKSVDQKTTEQKPPKASATSSPASAPVTSATPAPASGTVRAAQTPPPGSRQAVTTPAPAEVKASAPPPQHVSAKKPQVKKKAAPAQHHSARTGDSGLIAKDTVVYYNRKGTAPTPGSASNTKQ